MRAADYFIVVCVLLFVFGGGVLSTPDRVVVVYESSEYTPPAFVPAVLREAGLPARVVDQDVVTGDGQTPATLKAAIDAAKQNGLPAVVLLSGDRVVSVFDVPATAEQLQEAVR